MQQFLKIIRFFYLLLKSGNYHYAKACWNFIGAFNKEYINSIKVDGTNLEYEDCRFSPVKMVLFGNSFSKLAFLKRFFVIQDHTHGLLFIDRAQQGLNLLVRIPDNVGVLEEIFIHQLSRFEGVDSCVVLDVGMNVGYASLAFAIKHEVKHVYGFELVPETNEWAKYNFSINEALNQKITHYPYGLDIADRELDIPKAYSGAVGASASEFVIQDQKSRYAWNTESTHVYVKDVCDEVERIKNAHPKEGLVMKLDCEGAEYGILQRLDDQGLLNQFSVLMIEWHIKGPDFLLEILSANNFRCFAFDYPGDFSYGFIYAVNYARA